MSEAAVSRGGVSRQELDGGGERGTAEDEVDQEHRPPAEPEQVGVDQEAGEDRAADRGQAQDRAERAEGLA
jgi:hypothetical protein